MKDIYTVGVIGGGVSGVVTALQFAEHDIESVLFEKEKTVVNGPPFCHLHAGGNLYPDISDKQCRKLMKQSIDMARLFPQSIDERPTFISIPKTEKYEVAQIENRLDMLVSYYKELIKEDDANKVLGEPENYYKIYTEEDIIELSKEDSVKIPTTPDQWMTNAFKLVDYTKLKMPIILVQEYGWNLFRLGAQAQLALETTIKCNLKLNTDVTEVKDLRNQGLAYNWEIVTKEDTFKVQYLVNSCGFKTGIIDELLELKTERLIEFKAAYVSKWKPIEGLIPELIFHGERGTPHGMAQLTPYCDDFYQIHGMTENITLFENGLVKSEGTKVQPEFSHHITKKLKEGWNEQDTKVRTENAIDFVAEFVPDFKSATVGGPPLFGAQQIPGKDPTLRVGEVSFPSDFYARSEIVKASSALTVANQIIAKIQEYGLINTTSLSTNVNSILDNVTKDNINILADKFTVIRGYPLALSRLIIERN